MTEASATTPHLIMLLATATTRIPHFPLQLFDDLAVPKDNLFSLSDLADQRSTSTVCKSLWDLQLALAALEVKVRSGSATGHNLP